MRKPVVVTGAAGFIAFHLIARLLREKQPVIGFDNFDPFYDRSVKERNLEELRRIAAEAGTRFDFEERDLTAIGNDWRAGEELEGIIHLAAKAGVRPSLQDPEGYLRANVQGTLRLLEFSKARGLHRFVFGSSSSVYGDDTPAPFRETAVADRPISPYAASKRTGELYCATYAHLYGLTIAALRFFTVYGPRQRPDLAIHKFARQISSGEEITLYGNGGTERDYTFVDDIVTGVVGAWNWTARQDQGKFEVFNLGGSATTPLSTLVLLIEKELGTPARIRFAPMQPGDVQRTFADVSKAQRELDYRPTTDVRTGIAAFVEWFKREGAPTRRGKKAA